MASFRSITVLALLALALLLPSGLASYGQTTGTLRVVLLGKSYDTEGNKCSPTGELKGAVITVKGVRDDHQDSMTLRSGTIETAAFEGEKGCVFSLTVRIGESNRSDIRIDGDRYASVRNTLLAQGYTIAFDEHGSRTLEVDGSSVPAPEPTPRTRSVRNRTPTPTPSPTPKPTQAPPLDPAGLQRDGTYLLRGYLVLTTDQQSIINGMCFGERGYDDIGEGTQVVVRDGNNNVLGIGRMATESHTRQSCTFIFEISVPESSFYQITITHRGEMLYTFDELEDTNWTVFLTLGS